MTEFDKNIVIERILEAGLKPPQELTLMITQGCNLQCGHCLLKCIPIDRSEPVPSDAVIRKVIEFAAIGGSRINLTGGEALTHPDWFNILNFCCRETDLAQVCLQSNATLLSPSIVNDILTLPLEKLTIQVSLDGTEAGAHDLVRGPGSFKGVIKGLGLLVAAGMGRRTKVAFTEMNHNFDQLPQLVNMVEEMGLGGLVGGCLVKGGRAAQSKQLALPTPTQYRQLLRRYLTDHCFRRQYDKRGNISAIEWYKGHLGPEVQKCTCISNLFITATGRLYPCVMLLHEGYAVPHAYSRSLFEAVMEVSSLWAELPVLHNHRREYLEMCYGCKGHNHCAGGCMGRAYAVHGRLNMIEDRCALRKAVYDYTTS